MRHYSAIQRSDGKWDYTCGNRATGYCHDYMPMVEQLAKYMSKQQLDNFEANKDKYHSCGHDSKQEACNCYKQYNLDHYLTFTDDKPKSDVSTYVYTQYKCEICGDWTNGHADVGYYVRFNLCASHRSREFVERLYSVNESWES